MFLIFQRLPILLHKKAFLPLLFWLHFAQVKTTICKLTNIYIGHLKGIFQSLEVFYSILEVKVFFIKHDPNLKKKYSNLAHNILTCSNPLSHFVMEHNFLHHLQEFWEISSPKQFLLRGYQCSLKEFWSSKDQPVCLIAKK